VVDELRRTLTQLEASVQQFFYHPANKAPLQEVPSQLAQMRGVFSVLGLEQAALAMVRMRASVEQFLLDEIDVASAPTGVFLRFGSSLDAIGFLIDVLGYQRELARKLFAYDDDAGEFRCLLGSQTMLLSVAPAQDDQSKVIGSLRVALPLYNVYLNEADEWSRRLITELSEWALELHRPVFDSTIELAHSLFQASGTVGFRALSEMAGALERVLRHVQRSASGSAAQARIFLETAEVMRRLLHQFAAGFLKPSDQGLLDALDAIRFAPADVPGLDTPSALLAQLGSALRQWTARPDNLGARSEALRVLQMLTAAARGAQALQLGEMAQRMASAIEALAMDALQTPNLAFLLADFDAMQASVESLRSSAERH
jgi:HPt (histidine-containing phosphotransfer) domain-containing protein